MGQRGYAAGTGTGAGAGADGVGTGTAVQDAVVPPLADNPSMAAGEITDKGYVNQRLVLSRRAADVAALYASPAEPRVVIAHSTKAT